MPRRVINNEPFIILFSASSYQCIRIFNLYRCRCTLHYHSRPVTPATLSPKAVLHDLADKLLVYECRHIDESFIKKLKKEMHKLVNDAKGDHDLDRIPSTRQYQTRMQKRVKRHKLAKDTILAWKNDAGEYAERIWKWWKHRKEKYPYHGVTIRLIAYAQLSSCSVERVFSKLERIVTVTSDNIKEDMCEVRLLLQVNGDLDEMYNALVVNFGE